MASTQERVLIDAVESPVTPETIDIGSIVNGVYVEMNVNGVDNSGSVQVFHWKIEKKPANMAVSSPSAYMQDDKKFILKRGMEMLPEIPIGSGGTVQTKRIFFVKIPPRLRRFDDGDRLVLQYINTSASGVNFCGFAIYKEFK